MEALTLRSARLRAEVLPDAAGGLARFDRVVAGKVEPVLRPYEHAAGMPPPLPSRLACFPLVPWSNRIAPGGFAFGGCQVAPLPNRPGEPCPIHGDGWQYPWRVEARTGSSVDLLLDRRDAAPFSSPFSSPFSYLAHLSYCLGDSALDVRLAVTNTGEVALPFGLGLHPWLPRRPGVTLRARASGTWTRDALGLPAEPIALPPAWAFAGERALPDAHVDHVFRGWDGVAQVCWPDTGLRLDIVADMAYYILYAPAEGDFFCFEPVDHAINAHNLPGGPGPNGLTVLAPGATLARRVAFRVGDGERP